MYLRTYICCQTYNARLLNSLAMQTNPIGRCRLAQSSTSHAAFLRFASQPPVSQQASKQQPPGQRRRNKYNLVRILIRHSFSRLFFSWPGHQIGCKDECAQVVCVCLSVCPLSDLPKNFVLLHQHVSWQPAVQPVMFATAEYSSGIDQVHLTLV